MFKKKGFTLIELVMIIVILGILAAVAIPKYVQLQSEAKVAAEKGVVGGVRAAIMTYYANECKLGTCAFPAAGALDSTATDGACTSSNVCFDNVLVNGITADWTKAGDAYTGPAAGTYTYDNSDGSFK